MIEITVSGLPTVVVLILLVGAMVPFILLGLFFIISVSEADPASDRRPFKIFTFVYWVLIIVVFVYAIIWRVVLK